MRGRYIRFVIGVGLSLWCVATARGAPAESTEYRCVRLAQAPELDGEVEDDPAWQDVPAGTGYRNLVTGLPSERQTVFRLGYTPDALYVAVVCEEPAPDNILSVMGDGEPLWDEDSVEVFLSPDGEAELQFAVNSMGSRASPLTLRKWEAAAYIGDAAWTVEIALPWEVIGAFPEEAGAWGLNVCRNILSTGEKENSAWAPVQDGFHEPSNFGALTFEPVAEEVRAQVRARIEKEVVGQSVLVFSRPRTGVAIKTDSSQTRIAFNEGPHIAPKLSPDKNRVLFNSFEVTPQSKIQNPQSKIVSGVWIADAKGTKKERICSGDHAAWSPEGTKILFQRAGRIIERNLDSGQETALSPDGAPALAWPGYAPNGRIVCADEAGKHVYLLSPGEEGALAPLLEGESRSAPRCSPDGATLAWQDGTHLYLTDLDTRETRQLTIEPGVQAWPVWAADSRSLCYLQAPSPFPRGGASPSARGGPSPFADEWSLCHVAIDNPGLVHRIERKVYQGFDWNGVPPEPTKTDTLPGTRLALWCGKGRLRPKKTLDLASQRGYSALPKGGGLGPLKDAVVIENDWLVLHLSRKGVLLLPKDKALAKTPVTLGLASGRGPARVKVDSLRLVQHGADRAAVEAVFNAGSAEPLAATFTVARTRPMIEVRPASMGARLEVRADLALAVVPDRFGNDLIVSPDRALGKPQVRLPRAPVVLGCIEDAGAMLVVAACADAQSFEVAAGSADALGGIAAVDAHPGVFVGVLCGERLWQQPELTQTDDQQWQAAWEKPFHAEWRLAVEAQDTPYARMWNMDDLAELTGKPLPIDAAFAKPPQGAVVYAWGRDIMTPPDTLTPMDLLLDALGIDGYVAALDIKGICTYRSADVWAPFRELTTRELGWRPWMAHQEKRGFGVLEVMAGATAAGTEGTRAWIAHFSEDAVNLLRGLDTRITEYEAFLDDLRTFSLAHDKGDAATFLASIARQADATLEQGRAAPKTELDQATNARERLLNQKPGGGIMPDTEEFKAFSQRCREILSERQHIVSEYRAVAKKARDGAGRLVLDNPETKPLADDVRAMTHRILRHRYYLEGDWRGETPWREWRGESEE